MPSVPVNDCPLAAPATIGAADAYLNAIVRAVAGEIDPAREPPLTRRGFLRLGALAGGGLVLAFRLGEARAGRAAAPGEEFAPNAFVRVGADGSILIYSKGPEIGQGIKTAFALIIAEELDADWSAVRVEQAPINPAVYGRQSAGGSRSIALAWDQLRRAGALARALLVAAAAQEWGVAATSCTTRRSVVTHAPSGRSLGYGRLAQRAAGLPLPDEKSLIFKARGDWQLLGTRVGGVDSAKIVRGAPLFGIDQRVPHMHYATYQKCPAVGGRVRTVNLEQVRAMPGVTAVFVLEGTGKPTEVMPGVAVVATSTWAALRAKRARRVTWDVTHASKDRWSAAVSRARELAKTSGSDVLRESGDPDRFLGRAHATVEAFYTYPFLAHAPLEPQNCTASYRDGAVEIWAPTQTPDPALKLVADMLDVAAERVTIHQTRVGGGFGRRLMNDFMCEAVLISKQAGVPVKLQWTREDDMAHDFYRVGGFHAFKGAVDERGRIAAWQDHFITFSADGTTPVTAGGMQPTEFPALLVPHFRLMQSTLPLSTPCGFWRAPGSCAIAFATQSFLHELSSAARRDHLQFLLELLGEPRWLAPQSEFALNTGRAAAVIRLAAQQSGWGEPLPPGRARGLAFHFSHAGHFAEVAEVSVEAGKKLRVHRVTVAGDVGPVINLSGAENQCEGAVIDGLSTLLGLEITMEAGRIEQANFDRYPLLRIAHAPRVDVHFIQSDFPPTGLGEPALPPLAPAVCNAIFAASGHRVRTLPLTREGFRV
jgi:isoquinoline 1-oxidoreductase subunit beta